MRIITAWIACLQIIVVLQGLEAADKGPEIHVSDSFEMGADRWAPTDPQKWSVDEKSGNHVFHIHGGSNYTPPFRSPPNIALLKDVVVEDCVLTARTMTLQDSKGHRDMCLIFGYQDAAHFYYVHLGQETNPHTNQIMIVNGAPRRFISEKTNKGTPWKENAWHQVKLVRKIENGLIEVYFDNMQTPQIVAHDKTFTWGQVGLGTFDDRGLWDDFTLTGTRHNDHSAATPPAN